MLEVKIYSENHPTSGIRACVETLNKKNHYHNLWDVIVNGDLEEEHAPTRETSAPPTPKNVKQLAAKRNQEREAIKSRFGGNEESKKMQKNVLKHLFENFYTTSNESVDKAYDRFQKLISQLEVHGAPISKKDINQKFLRSLPPSWSQIALNLAFLSSENTSSTNEVSTAGGDFGVSTAGGINQVSSTPCAHDVIYEDDLEELDLRWQVAMLIVKVRKFIQMTGRNMDFKEKRPVSLDKSKIECYNWSLVWLDLHIRMVLQKWKNKTLIEAARTMLADSLLPIIFWAEAVNTACYVLNRVLVIKPQNKTPYELLIANLMGNLMKIIFLDTLPLVNVTGTVPNWMFDLDFHTNSMNYIPVSVEIQVNVDVVEDVPPAAHEKPSESSPKDNDVQDTEDVADKEGKHQMIEDEEVLHDELEKMIAQERAAQTTSINKLSTGRSSVSTATTSYVSAASTPIVADFNNMDDTINVSPIPTLKIHKNHPKDQILGDPKSAIQTRGKIQKASSAQQALFKLQKVWILVDLPSRKKAIGRKWVFKNKTDERNGLIDSQPMISELVAQGFRQEEGIDYDVVFAPVARIEAIMLFLAFASYMGFTVYQMDVKSAFLYGTIEEEVYVHQPPGFVNPAHLNKVYKVIKALYGLHQAPRAWYETLSSFLMENGFRRGTIDKTLFIKKKKSDIMLVQVYVDDIIFGSTKKSMCTEFEDCMHKRFQMSSMGELTFFLGLQVKQQPDGIFISQDKYVADILKKFDFWSIRTATTPIESNKPLVKDEDGEDVDVHVYRSIIGSLMYLTASRPDIMFAICACARFQVTLKALHLNAVKRIFSDYGGAILDRKSTTGGCQFLGRRLISWQCKKQTIVANSITKAEYVAAANCRGQVLWIQNQMMDYGFNLMNTRIHIDNESTISVIKNPVAHSRTKHIEIRFHFIRDCYEKRLIEVIKIHTDSNVADLLTKGFDVIRFHFLVVSIGMLNL
ncbi:putative ribonuclease H-like domain-containing protein [Tanacetum coccineum]